LLAVAAVAGVLGVIPIIEAGIQAVAEAVVVVMHT
jgi:hypothetical protein